jgi:hypothetical protein
MLIRDVIQEYIINDLDNRLNVLEVSEVTNDLQDIMVCNIKWIKLYEFFTIGEQAYVVTNISGRTITVEIAEGADAITLNSDIRINKPLLFDGTLSNTRVEWAGYSDEERAKLPFIWLVSPTETNTANDQGQQLATAILKLWFIHWSDWTKLNADRQNEAVRPLYALYKEFMNTINRNTHIFEGYDNVSDRDFPKLGVLGANGVEKTVFDSTLSAIEVDLNLNIFKRCCDFC